MTFHLHFSAILLLHLGRDSELEIQRCKLSDCTYVDLTDLPAKSELIHNYQQFLWSEEENPAQFVLLSPRLGL